MNRYIALLIVLLIGTNSAGWMAVREEAKAHAATEKLHQAACQELNELRSTIAAGGTVEL